MLTKLNRTNKIRHEKKELYSFQYLPAKDKPLQKYIVIV